MYVYIAKHHNLPCQRVMRKTAAPMSTRSNASVAFLMMVLGPSIAQPARHGVIQNAIIPGHVSTVIHDHLIIPEHEYGGGACRRPVETLICLIEPVDRIFNQVTKFIYCDVWAFGKISGIIYNNSVTIDVLTNVIGGY